MSLANYDHGVSYAGEEAQDCAAEVRGDLTAEPGRGRLGRRGEGSQFVDLQSVLLSLLLIPRVEKLRNSAVTGKTCTPICSDAGESRSGCLVWLVDTFSDGLDSVVWACRGTFGDLVWDLLGYAVRCSLYFFDDRINGYGYVGNAWDGSSSDKRHGYVGRGRLTSNYCNLLYFSLVGLLLTHQLAFGEELLSNPDLVELDAANSSISLSQFGLFDPIVSKRSIKPSEISILPSVAKSRLHLGIDSDWNRLDFQGKQDRLKQRWKFLTNLFSPNSGPKKLESNLLDLRSLSSILDTSPNSSGVFNNSAQLLSVSPINPLQFLRIANSPVIVGVSDIMIPGYLLLLSNVCYGLLFLVGVPGNLFTVLGILLCSDARAISTSTYIFNLAIADCLYLSWIPLIVAKGMIYNEWVWGDWVCKLYFYTSCVTQYASVAFLILLCIDRHLAVVWPICSMRWRNSRAVAFGMTMVAWVAVAALMLPILSFASVQHEPSWGSAESVGPNDTNISQPNATLNYKCQCGLYARIASRASVGAETGAAASLDAPLDSMDVVHYHQADTVHPDLTRPQVVSQATLTHSKDRLVASSLPPDISSRQPPIIRLDHENAPPGFSEDQTIVGPPEYDVAETERRFFAIYTFAIGFLLPLLAMWTLYITVLYRLWGRSARSASGRNRQKTIRVTKLVFAVLCVFTFCWSPLWIFNLVIEFAYHHIAHYLGDAFYCVAVLAYACNYLSSALNPILYTFFSEAYRQSCRARFVESGLSRTSTARRRSNKFQAIELLDRGSSRKLLFKSASVRIGIRKDSNRIQLEQQAGTLGNGGKRNAENDCLEVIVHTKKPSRSRLSLPTFK